MYMQANTHANRININKSPLKAKLKFVCIIFYYVYVCVPMNAEPLEARAWGLLARELHIVMRWTGHTEYTSIRPYIDIADTLRAKAMARFNAVGDNPYTPDRND